MSGYHETPLVFESASNALLGIACVPNTLQSDVGVVIVVGGPQYRVGSHRQFTLLARHLAMRGVASLRFDYRGHGDSAGPAPLGVDGLEGDIQSAIQALLSHNQGLKRVALWGLCGAASAGALYAPSDARVAGLIMLNPWVRTEQGLAKAQLRHYYFAKLSDRAFWRKLASGKISLGSSVKGLLSVAARLFGGNKAAAPAPTPAAAAEPTASHAADPGDLPVRLMRALRQSNVPALIILSGNTDLTANEFRDLAARSNKWKRWMAQDKVQLAEVEGSSHTFARADWREEVERLCAQWVLAQGGRK